VRRPSPTAFVIALLGWTIGLATTALAQSGGSARAGKRELNFFPIIGGDSDVGFGFGEVSDIASLGTTEGTFRWRIENAAFVTFKIRNNSVIVPFLDVYALLTVPSFGPGGRFRLELRPSYTDERTLGYYGIGNASPDQASISEQQREYRRIHPTLAARLRMRVLDDCFVVAGSSYTQSWLEVPSDSLLVKDRSTGPPEVRQLLGSFASHGVELLEAGLEYDTRDNETVTQRGQYHALLARISPSLGSALPYEYVQLDFTGRFYTNPIPRWLSVSFRVVGDVFLGTVPFYELARFDDTPAIGGGKAIRGVPAQRYHGKVKLFENLEARSELFHFTVKNKPLILGAALFFDSGRTWSEPFHAHPELDGTGIGLKYGIGGGLRFQEGKTFVVRADLAWSPDAQPIGGYFSAGEIF
jgi:hypothetical protein